MHDMNFSDDIKKINIELKNQRLNYDHMKKKISEIEACIEKALARLNNIDDVTTSIYQAAEHFYLVQNPQDISTLQDKEFIQGVVDLLMLKYIMSPS